jgi:hypothetical protein
MLSVAGLASAAPLRWRVAGRIDGHALTGLACPSVSLCVAVDRAGDVISSTDPTAARPRWQTADVDGSEPISGLACPTASLCVAVDRMGQVLSSRDPTGRASAWQAAAVNSGAPLTGVSCAAVSLCAAIGKTVWVSTQPAAGAASWSDAQVGLGEYYECQHYGYTGPSCDAPPTGVSCVPASRLCVSANDAGEAIGSSDPAAGPATWHPTGPAVGEYLDVSCASISLCVAVCPTGVDTGDGVCEGASYEGGVLVSWNPSRADRAGSSVQLTPDNLTGAWCVPSSLCFASDGRAASGLVSTSNGPGHLFASTDPPSGRSGWVDVFTDRAGVTGVACPSSTCLAVDSAGRLLVGPRPLTARQITRSLLAQLAPPSPNITLRRLVAARGVRLRFMTPTAGQLVIAWYVAGTRTGATAVVARASARFARPDVRTVTVTLTSAGRRLLARDTRATITVIARFSPTGSPSLVRHTTFVIRQ